MRRALAALALTTPFVLGAASLVRPEGDVPRAFRIQDPEIVESSGLAFVGGLAVTLNDSGDRGRVFALDPATGRTVGVTSWADEPTDLEALAPAGGDAVWVGDLGDNTASRETVEVLRVPVQRGDRTVDPVVRTLVYPDGPRDAETLLVHPRSGRLLVATKGVFGGDLYAVPQASAPGRAARLRPLGTVLPLATDGAFFPDGRHLVLRSYTRAVVYRWPTLDAVAGLDLPSQEQGEGIAVTDDDRVFLSSEGSRQWVVELRLPRSVRRELDPPAPSPRAGPTTSSVPDPALEDRLTGLRDRDAWGTWLAAGAAVLAVGSAAFWVVRRSRRRG